VRNRPDIRQAERTLAAATAIQGVALSEMYPKLSLSTALGLGSKQTSTLLTGSSKTWSLGAGALLPLFDFGRIRADIDTADALQEQAFLTYQKTVLNALKEVENALVAYMQEKQRLDLITKSVAAQATATQLIDARYRNGLISFLEVLDAKRSLYTAQLAEAQSRAALSMDLVALYKALGGGWQIRQKDR
jgi:outer membrane protein TolC